MGRGLSESACQESQEAEAGKFRVQGLPGLHDPGKKVGPKKGKKDVYDLGKSNLYV